MSGPSVGGGLGHTLQPRHVTMIALGGVIGAGLFVGASTAISLGGPGVVLVYAASGVLILLIMRMLGEMAVAQPGAGSSFAGYATAALGPWAGFVIRWLFCYCMIFGIGAETVAGAKLLHEAGVPGPEWAVGLMLILAITLTNLSSVRAFGELEFWLASLKVGAIGLFIATGAIFLAAFGPGPQKVHSTLLGHGGPFPHGVGGMLAALPVVLFSMGGSEMATIAAAESADPAGNVVRAGRSVAMRIAIFYVLSVLLITMIVPWNTLVPGLSPFKATLDAIGVPGSGRVMSAVVLIAVVSCLNSEIYGSSRMLYELGRSGDGPGLLERTAPNRTPWVGVLAGFVGGSAAVVGQMFLSQDVFSLLAGSAGAIMLFIYILIALAEIRQRRRLEAVATPIKVKMWLFPWLSYASIIFMAGLILLLASMREQRLMLSISTAAIAVVFCALWAHRRSKADRVSGAFRDSCARQNNVQ